MEERMTTDRADWRAERKIESIIPVTCKMITQLEINNGSFLDGNKCDKFTIVGQIIAKE